MGFFDWMKADNSDCQKVNIQDFINKYIKGACIPEDVFIELQKLKLEGKKYAFLKKEVIESIEETRLKNIEEENALFECVRLNNLGIEQEKKGNIEKAIEIYEQNIKGLYEATHSYDRLMILYRKRKEYEKEIAVIEKAIEVFSNVNRNYDLNKYKERLEKAKLLKEKSESQNSNR